MLRFRTRRRDFGLTADNAFNPVHGYSVLQWLRQRLPSTVVMREPVREQWGWYVPLEFAGHHYRLGACAERQPDGSHECRLSLERVRNLGDRLLRRNRITAADPCLREIRVILDGEPGLDGLRVD